MNHPAGEGSPPSPGGGVCLVLGAGGLRGLAHVGVLKALRRASIPIESIIGVSIGSLVAAFYAGLGLEPDEIGAELFRVNTSTFFSMGVALRRWGFLSVRARRAVSRHLELLGRLENLRLDRLHFGVRRLGLLAMDLPGGQEVFAATGLRCPVPPGRLVMGGISIPGFFPPVRVECAGRTYRLADGGFSRSVPVERAFQPPFRARRVLVVDLRVIRGFRERRRDRWPRLESEHGESLVRLLPDVKRTGTIFCRRGQGSRLVRAGEEAVTGDLVSRLTLSRGGC